MTGAVGLPRTVVGTYINRYPSYRAIAVNDELFRRFVRDLVEDLKQVSGASFEKLMLPLWTKIAGGPVQANGLNREGAPISGALDALWPDGSVSEASSHRDYFDNKERKLRHDIRHVRKAAPHVRHLRMFCTREAGPTARTRQDSRRARYAKRGFAIEVWAGQDLAEYIVKECLLDEVLVERIAPILPNLRRITEQFAASQRLPDLDPAFRGRGKEIALVTAKLAAERVAVVYGLGGIGKSELACAVAHRLRDQFEQVIWIDAAALERVGQLRAYDVRSNGYELNVLGILGSQSALVVLDNVAVDLDLDALVRACGPGSNVLITSQAKFGKSPVALEELDRSDATAILCDGTAAPCPDAILDRVLTAVGGHPLLLRILNRLVVEGGLSWEAMVGECDHLPSAIDDRRVTVAQRIVRRNLPVLAANLVPFVWARSASLDEGLAKRLIGLTGLDILGRWSFVARSHPGSVRLHDIVFACAMQLRAEITIDPDELRMRLEAYLRAGIDPKGIDFVRVSRRHHGLLARLLGERPEPGIVRYAYLHGAAPRDLASALIGDPIADAIEAPVDHRREWVLSIVEAVESGYRHARDHGRKSDAKNELANRLSVFDTLAAVPDIGPENRITIRHHRAKSLLKLGRADDARTEFEAIVSGGAGNYPSRLQLARLLERDASRAKDLIFEIIEAERSAPGTVQITTLIETLATLRRRHLRGFTTELTKRFGPFMAQMIKAAAWTGEAQTVRAFAAVGPEWSYSVPDLFLEVFEEVDLGSPDGAEDDDERVAVGRILVAARKMFLRRHKPTQADAALERALLFFEGLEQVRPFAAVHRADALLQAGRPTDASEVLDRVAADKRDEFWHLRRAEAALRSGGSNGLDHIDRGLTQLRSEEYRSTFLSVKADLLHAASDLDDVTVLDAAIACCTNDTYRKELELKRGDWMLAWPHFGAPA